MMWPAFYMPEGSFEDVLWCHSSAFVGLHNVRWLTEFGQKASIKITTFERVARDGRKKALTQNSQRGNLQLDKRTTGTMEIAAAWKGIHLLMGLSRVMPASPPFAHTILPTTKNINGTLLYLSQEEGAWSWGLRTGVRCQAPQGHSKDTPPPSGCKGGGRRCRRRGRGQGSK